MKNTIFLIITLLWMVSIVAVGAQHPIEVRQQFSMIEVRLDREYEDAYLIVMNNKGRILHEQKVYGKLEAINILSDDFKPGKEYVIVLDTEEYILQKSIKLKEKE